MEGADAVVAFLVFMYVTVEKQAFPFVNRVCQANALLLGSMSH